MQSFIVDTAFWAGEDFPTDSFTSKDRSEPPEPAEPLRRVYFEKSYCPEVFFDDTVETDEYAPAFRYGADCRRRLAAVHATFESAEPDLARNWDNARGTSILAGTPAGLLDWQRARYAVRDGWNQAYHSA
jgi:hypothetical protein